MQKLGWTERLRRREATIAGQNDRAYLFEGRERVSASHHRQARDIILLDDLEKAVIEYSLNSRDGGDMHSRKQ
jgi:hypothetical protein